MKPARPLSGLGVQGSGMRPVPTAEAFALQVLGDLGASPVEISGTGRERILRLRPPSDEEDARAEGGVGATAGLGLPAGTFQYACGLVMATAALISWRQGQPFSWSAADVAVQLRLPEVMAASYGSPPAMLPPPPIAAPGGGWVHADLGSPGDAEDFATLLSVLAGDVEAPELAQAAQEWRLPVCDYRRRSQARRGGRRGQAVPIVAETPGESPGTRGRVGSTFAICDLTSMWAGPLATWVLGGVGAAVWKIEPRFRPDGTRALAGGGIYPGGRQLDPGRDSAMFNALNAGKSVLDLDLRLDADRARLCDVVSGCDAIIDSFSPRVMPNLGLDGPLPGTPLRISVPAFPPGPQRHWVAYGSGVHAASGLGDNGEGGFGPPPVSYPDPLAGLLAALAVMAGLTGRQRGWPGAGLEVSLAASLRPLVDTEDLDGCGVGMHADRSPTDAVVIGRELLERSVAGGGMEARSVAGSVLWHPRSIFRCD